MAGWPLKNYFKETRRPIYSAALVAPFFLVYHIGTLFLRTTHINGADALIMRLLRPFSVNTMFASALVLLVCFLIWQWRTRGSWTIDTPKLLVLYLESGVLAVLLLIGFGWISRHLLAVSGSPREPGPLGMLVLYCGAGVYEELFFRGFLLGGLWFLFRKIGNPKGVAPALLATLVAAAIFSMFHYIGAAGEAFTWNSFLQRALAGIYFSGIFVTRGFGVAAACHAIYDILVGLILI